MLKLLNNINKNILLFLRYILVIMLVYFLLSNLDFKELKISFDNINFYYASLFFLLIIIITLVSTLKTRYLFEKIDLIISFRELFFNSIIGQFFNNFVPASTGSDIYKYVEFNSKIDQKNNLIAILFYDKLFGILVLIVNVCVFSSYLLYHKFTTLTPFLDLFVVVLIFVFFLIYIFKNKIKQILFNLFNKMSKNVILDYRIALKTFIYYEVIFFLVIISYLVLFKAIDFFISPIVIVQIVPLVFIGEYLPFSINSIGIREGLNIYTLGFFNIKKETVIVAILLGRILNLILSLFGGLLFLLKKYNGRNTRLTL